MRHGSLFSGIGGFDLAAQWMGWENVFQVEIDPFCQKVLEKNFPNVKRYGDIKEFDGTKYRGAIDVLSGGFPCQPYSQSGRRKGKADSRHLWPEMFRIIGEIQPRFILAENVYGIVTWNEGLVFEEVQSQMEDAGYEVQSFIIPACGVNAPHQRDRVWFVAYSNCEHRAISVQQWGQNQASDINPGRGSKVWTASNPDTQGLQIGIQSKITGIYEEEDKFTPREFARTYPAPNWNEFPTTSPICGRNDGVSNRVDRIKSLGNAIVPQVAFEIFKAIDLI